MHFTPQKRCPMTWHSSVERKLLFLSNPEWKDSCPAKILRLRSNSLKNLMSMVTFKESSPHRNPRKDRAALKSSVNLARKSFLRSQKGRFIWQKVSSKSEASPAGWALYPRIINPRMGSGIRSITARRPRWYVSMLHMQCLW